MEDYESFDDYSSAQSKQNQVIISGLRKMVADLAPKLKETVKWGNGCWLNGKLPVMFVHCKEDHVQFGFYGGSLLNNSEVLLQGKADYVRHIRIEMINNLNEDEYKSLIKEAATLDYKS
jgi:hypothetical protein